jgi:hypothetical protein
MKKIATTAIMITVILTVFGVSGAMAGQDRRCLEQIYQRSNGHFS